MPDVFISYARSTAVSARRIADALRSDGYSIWIDDELPAHRDYPTVIEEHLRAAKAVLVLWSSDAVKSRWVPAEADVAHQAGTLVQLSLDGATPPLPFNRMQCAHLPGWNGDLSVPEWRKVTAGIAELVGQPAPSVTSTTQSLAAAGPAAPAGLLLAVLAFDNLSGDPEVDFFSDGVSEEIQQTVAKGSDLKVVARSSSFQFRGADKAVRKVASELRATHLLDGSVRRSGSRVRISAQLVECAGEVTLWSNRFDGDLSDVFSLQERIAEAVAEALKTTLARRAQPELMDPVVYELLLKARGIISEAGGLYDDVATAATPLLEQVVQALPDHAPAWELLARSRAWTLRSGIRTTSYEEGYAGVIEAAEAALRLDPRSGGAYGALAMLEPWGAYGARERLLKQALSAAPNDPVALTDMSNFCWGVGRFRDALRLAEQACELNPMMPAARLVVAQMRTYVGDYEAADRMYRELHQRWPRNSAILIAVLNFSASLNFWATYNELADAAKTFEGWEAAHLRATLRFGNALSSDDPAPRRELLDRFSAQLAKTGTLPLNYLEGLSSLGFTDEAFALAERASFDHMFDPDGPVPSGYFPGAILGRWSALNKTPRFVDLCHRLGLCAYWTQSDRWPDCTDWAPFDFKAEVRRRVTG